VQTHEIATNIGYFFNSLLDTKNGAGFVPEARDKLSCGLGARQRCGQRWQSLRRDLRGRPPSWLFLQTSGVRQFAPGKEIPNSQSSQLTRITMSTQFPCLSCPVH
jgi:hypothetical protein